MEFLVVFRLTFHHYMKKQTFTKEVMFLLLFVYLSVFLVDNSKTYEGIPMKFGGQTDLHPQKN